MTTLGRVSLKEFFAQTFPDAGEFELREDSRSRLHRERGLKKHLHVVKRVEMDDMPFKDKTDEELGDIILPDKEGSPRLLPDEKGGVVSTGDKTFRDKRARVEYVVSYPEGARKDPELGIAFKAVLKPPKKKVKIEE